MANNRTWSVVGAVAPCRFEPGEGRLIPSLMGYVEGGAIQAWWRIKDGDLDKYHWEIILGRLAPTHLCYPVTKERAITTTLYEGPHIYASEDILGAYIPKAGWGQRWLSDRSDASHGLSEIMTLTKMSLDWADQRKILGIEASERKTDEYERRNTLGLGLVNEQRPAGWGGGGAKTPRF